MTSRRPLAVDDTTGLPHAITAPDIIDPSVVQVVVIDSNSVPSSPPDTYLRFERDIAGDVQHIYLGTLT